MFSMLNPKFEFTIEEYGNSRKVYDVNIFSTGIVVITAGYKKPVILNQDFNTDDFGTNEFNEYIFSEEEKRDSRNAIDFVTSVKIRKLSKLDFKQLQQLLDNPIANKLPIPRIQSNDDILKGLYYKNGEHAKVFFSKAKLYYGDEKLKKAIDMFIELIPIERFNNAKFLDKVMDRIWPTYNNQQFYKNQEMSPGSLEYILWEIFEPSSKHALYLF